MKALKMLMVVATVCAAASLALAAAEGGKKRERVAGLRGKIVRVEGVNVTLQTWARKQEDRKEVTVVTDDKTAVTIDGKEAKVADLKADMYALVTPETGTAQKILARTKLEGGPGKGGRKKPAPAPAPQE